MSIREFVRRWEWRTWHFENAVVAVALSAVAITSGGSWIEWVGAVGVFAGFCCASIGERMREREAARAKPSVECHEMWRVFYWTKEAAWLTYFVALHAWSALVGCAIGVGYPLWRAYWRKIHPMKDDSARDLAEVCRLYGEGVLCFLDFQSAMIKAGIPTPVIDLMGKMHDESCARARTVREIRPLLNSVITSCLTDPGGEPMTNEKWAAAYAFVVLQKLGAKIEAEAEVRQRLTPGALDSDGEPNPDETDYLTWAAKSD